MRTALILTILCIALSGLLLPAAAQAGYIVNAPKYLGLERGLVGYWSFDGKDIAGVHAYDASGTGNRGVLSGPVRTAGKLGQALQFDGSNDYVDLLSPASLDNIPVKTVSAWIYPKTVGQNNNGYILHKSANTGFGWSFNICSQGDGDGHCQGEVLDRSLVWSHSFTTQTGTWMTPNNSITLNQWQHVLVVYDRTSIANDPRIYINGVQQTLLERTSPSGSPRDESANKLILGNGDYPFFDITFDGTIDDVRIYNRALSQDEIKRLYKIGGTARINTTIPGPTKGLVGHWTFDGEHMAGVHAYDASGNGNRGVLTGGPVRAAGKLGQGLQFDGSNDYVSVADTNNSLDLSSAFTISAWVLTRGDTGNFQVIAAKAAYPGQTYYFYLQPSGLELTLAIDATEHFTSSVTSLQPNQWYHVVGLFDNASNRIKLYIDGNLVLDAAETGNPSINDDDVLISNSTVSEFWNGKIDDLRIYNRALSADEIKRLYKIGATAKINTTLDGPQSGLVGWWTFDGKHMAGNRAFDASGQGNYGTLTGSNGLPVRTIGKMGQGMQFDGVDDYVDLNNPLSLTNIPVKTISAWIYPRSVGGNNSGRIVDKAGGTGFGWHFNICSQGDGDGHCQGEVLDRSLVWAHKFNTTSGIWMTPNNSIALNQWQHVLVVYDRTSTANNPTVYINGVSQTLLERTSPAGAVGDDSGEKITIGNRQPDVDYTFNGLIDDVRIYNRALSPDEIQRLYNLGR
jgi:hypothetical protein